MARQLATALLLAALLVISSAALAQRASDQAFLPITIRTSEANSSVVVVRGDHLWKISARHLEAVLGRGPKAGEVAPYWRVVIAANQAGLRSGDPDLIYPDEVVMLPERPSEQP